MNEGQIIKPREDWIDVLKGIMIIFVVIGHSWFPYSQYIYWFHMPVFFMISGYLFKPQKTTIKYLASLVLRYIVPCYCWWIINSLFLDSFSFGRLRYMIWGETSRRRILVYKLPGFNYNNFKCNIVY